MCHFLSFPYVWYVKVYFLFLLADTTIILLFPRIRQEKVINYLTLHFNSNRNVRPQNNNILKGYFCVRCVTLEITSVFRYSSAPSLWRWANMCLQITCTLSGLAMLCSNSKVYKTTGYCHIFFDSQNFSITFLWGINCQNKARFGHRLLIGGSSFQILKFSL